MAQLIKQSVTLPASAKKLFEMYLSPSGHASTLILSLTQLNAKSTRIDLVHLDLSDIDHEGVRKG